MNKVIHCSYRLIDWSVRIWSMTEKQVKIVNLEPLHGIPASFVDVFAGQAFVIWALAPPKGLAGDNNVLPPPPQLLYHITHYDFGVAMGIGFGIVEEVYTQFICCRHALRCGFLPNLTAVCNPSAEREFTHL